MKKSTLLPAQSWDIYRDLGETRKVDNEDQEPVNIYLELTSHLDCDRDVNNSTKEKKSIWSAIEGKIDVQEKKPRLKTPASYEIIGQENKKNGKIHVVKDIEENIYIALNEEEFFVWELLNGRRTVKEICGTYFERYQKISNMPFKLMQLLEEKNMLEISWLSPSSIPFKRDFIEENGGLLLFEISS